MTETVLDSVVEKVLQARDQHDPNVAKPPVVLLWPDATSQWAPVIDRLHDRLPVVTLGPYDEGARTGPAYWVRCVVTGELGGPGATPVLYLPGVGRDDLRAVEGCPPQLAPIAELQYRGSWFANNGRDWTVRAFLGNTQRGLGLDVARDAATDQALRTALPKLLDEPMRNLRRLHVLDSDYLHELVDPDPTGSVLKWLAAPEAFRTQRSDAEWKTFVAQCRSDFDIDPDTDGPVTAARRLGVGEGQWAKAWARFTDTPERYHGVSDLLRQAKPDDNLLAGLDEAWPQANDDAEERLAGRLRALAHASPGAARDELDRLWDEHRPRLAWVWAQLGQSPLAESLEHLARVADLTRAPLLVATVDAAVRDYADRGWQVDDAALRALAAAGDAQRATVGSALESVYRPWLGDAALGFQRAVGSPAGPGCYTAGPPIADQPGGVTVFADGLRLDVAHRVVAALDQLDVRVDTSLAALPTVTATSKPALAPVPPGSLTGGDGLSPARASSGAQWSQQVRTTLLAERGVPVIPPEETGDHSGPGWTEAGRIDAIGHGAGVGLVDELDREVARLGARVRQLLAAGWTHVEVVTDHGWLLLPGGLPKVELPVAVVEQRKGRCARLKPGSQVDILTVPWHWDCDIAIAVAPGIGCFEAGKAYEHGGVSPQECVVPRIRVTARSGHLVTGGPEIATVRWLGLLCRVEVRNVASGARLDLRAEPAKATSSVAEETKETTTGRVALFVADEDLEGEPAYLVLLGDGDRILVQKPVTIGRNR